MQTVVDILRALADPDIAAVVRQQHILTQELLALPAAFVKMQYDIVVIKALLAQVAQRQYRAEAVQAQHTVNIAELKEGQNWLKTEFANLRSEVTHSKVRRMYGRICQVANLRRPRWMEPGEQFELFDNADTIGIPENELLSCLETDLVTKAVSKADQTQQYAVVECSAAITQRDNERLKRNAAYYRRVTGCATYAIAIGAWPPENILAFPATLHCLAPSAKLEHPT